MIKTRKATRREILGWSMFDFANQAYTLLIVTVVFGDVYTRLVVGDAPDYRLGNLLWSAALCLSYALVVVAAPLLGAAMDGGRAKKRMLFASYVLTVASTALLYFVGPGHVWLGFMLIVVSNAAYSAGESFIASFLPFLGEADELGRISGLGWALGYAGGLVSAGFVLVFLGEVAADNFERIRWVGPFAAAFFLLAAIPTFLWVHEPAVGDRRHFNGELVRIAYKRVATTLRTLPDHPDLRRLFMSILFAMAGVYVIVAFSFIYGAQVIGWSEDTRALMFVVVQITALIGALAFGALQSRLGGRLTYALTLVLWIGAILAIYFVGELTALLNRALALSLREEQVFLFAGLLSGLSLGSSQSVGRALVGMFSPETRAAELFGYWGLTSKLAAIFGIFGVGMLQWAFGLQGAVLFCIVLFAAALLPLAGIDEARGVEAARRASRLND
ncbi:Major facilitator superfamily MFS_1 [Thauera humireducens]|uniref:MFS transporter n=1 Tax=Thauera humireducens TaxID=1134435 RepID=UPI002467A1A1|nr:MFS transporter [Thauera humireducens]CAH1746567.1 Major facilitator superfamily MFS_1 [Thauera humireducens]